MLEDLSVKDFALIDSVSLEFSPGFTILSGETGAGKSILIGSLTFLLGGRASPDMVRTGAEEARVSGTVFLPQECQAARAWLESRGISGENDRILLRRTLKTNGKSGSWIQDCPVTRGELAEFTSHIVDIHGQHDHQSLLKVDEHRRFLDSYAGLTRDVENFTTMYALLADKRRLRDEMSTSEKQRAEKSELLTFAVQEIESASLYADEEESLSAEEQRLSQHEKLFGTIEQLLDSLVSTDGALAKLKKARSNLEGATSIDTSLSPLLSRLDTSFYETEDITDALKRYSDSLSFDPARLETIEQRLAFIFRLKKKYGQSVSDILAYAENAKRELEQLSGWEENRSSLDEEITELEKTVYRLGSQLSARRKQASGTLQSSVETILSSLGMAGTRFRVGITLREGTDTMQKSGPYGFDTIEFMISANEGEPLKPLAKIASGGEISRVMLALKTVLASADETATLIFDEIDTGIGGEVALSVGAHLQQLSEKKQIICITHLASIAVRADNHIKIEKVVASGSTRTMAFAVSGEQRIEEVARMLAGDGFSAASVQHSRELLDRYTRDVPQ